MYLPDFIRNLPPIDINIDGFNSFLFQGKNHQIVFMQFDKDTNISEHFHAAQFGIVLEGKIDLIIDGMKNTYNKGDSYTINNGVIHSAKIYAPYSDMTFFDEKDRFSIKL